MTLEELLRPAPGEGGIDRKALAGLLVEAARNLDSSWLAEPIGITPRDPRLEQLRQLLVGREIELLARLAQVLDDPDRLAQAISDVLPTAIARASAEGSRLGQALTPAMEKATESSVRRDPRTLVNILYPLIVPAVRKSIGEAIDDSFQSFNESLKHSLTLRGLRWRLEAWRTGSSFAEVVLKRTLVYRVEHVFLIHGHTGLLIADKAAKDSTGQDPQLVSSMLTAIQDFVRDSFGADRQRGLDAVRFGDLRLWPEQGPSATLVAVIRGNPPESLHDTFRDVLSKVHAQHHLALKNFDGDASGFVGLEEQLEECLDLKQEASPSGRPRLAWIAILLTLAILLGIVGSLGYRSWREEQAWDGYLARLRAQPGIVVTETDERDGKWLVNGLRDPLASDPNELLRQSQVDPALVVSRWQPYQAMDPQFVLLRLQAALDPPRTVTLTIERDRIVAVGSAPITWLRHARTTARMLPLKPYEIDLSRVKDLDDAAFSALRDAIQSKEIRFDVNDAMPAQGQDAMLDELAAELNKLEDLSSNLHVTTRVMLTGHSDATGKGTFNLSISLGRAETIRALLRKRGVQPDLLAVRGAGPLEPLSDDASEAARSVNRRVSFSVEIVEE